MQGFVRISAAVPACGVADVSGNAERALALWERSHEQGDALVVYPELNLTGYTGRDLFHDGQLLARARRALLDLAERGRAYAPLAVFGLPLRVGGGLYNVAAAVQGGRVLGVVPKAYLPTYGEFEEARWFRPGVEVPPGSSVSLGGEEVPFGTDLLFAARDAEDFVVGLEVCEDLWVPVPPSAFQVGAGATVVCNLSASNFVVGKAELRRLLARSASDRGKCAYLYVAAGPGESSTDMAFDADAFICENGAVRAESKRFARDDQLVTYDVDLELLAHERLRTGTFSDCARQHTRPFRRVAFAGRAEVAPPLRRRVAPHPFLPTDPATLERRCWEIFEIQTNALATRMQAVGRPRLVLGVSGGLDSTHAALVCAGALDLVGQLRADLLCVTLPGLGTSGRTRGNAERLAEALGATFREVGIGEVTREVLAGVEHPAAEGCEDPAGLVERLRASPELGDATLQNVQARLRTLYLMTLANQEGGLVVGTGDLSEKALGWSTYAGDHIAMYDVNAGVPKTLVRFVIDWVANHRAESWSQEPEALREVLSSVLETPISPELLPPGAGGDIVHLSEDHLGPFELHDFFLYHLVRHGARPRRLLDLAQVAFAERYPLEELKEHLARFLRRFFQFQFKRSCTADAPKVGMVALSPRADWRMPSDARVGDWLAETLAYPDG
ncbi:MAG: NAD(+) synthase [Planctomycetota bacterium]|nr:MAG: NAD(+) synthase [Planctomycetota bacterium]